MGKILSIIKTILVFLLSFFVPLDLDNFHIIANITNPQQVLSKKKNEIVLVKDRDIFLYRIKEKKSEKIAERNPNDFVGISKDGDILLCTIEHFLINSYDDFSTKFTIKNLKDETEKELKFFETIRPIYLDEEKIIAVTAEDFLEQHQYLIRLSDGYMQESYMEKRKFPVKIPEDFDLKNLYYLKDGVYILEDIFGNLYLNNS
ncbi:hypothetical protein GX830_00790 [Candidatus Dojkabacteria bacterium]|nr:hypothetical protein [Candidatus Dojkabacteria bacterium]